MHGLFHDNRSALAELNNQSSPRFSSNLDKTFGNYDTVPDPTVVSKYEHVHYTRHETVMLGRVLLAFIDSSALPLRVKRGSLRNSPAK
jgi:hypothetical protein